MLCLIPGSRGEGSDPPGYHQTTKVTLTESPPESSQYMHIEKQVTLSILIMLVPQGQPRQPKRRVRGLLIDPNAWYQNTQMTTLRFSHALLL